MIGINAVVICLHRKGYYEGSIHHQRPAYGTERVYNALRLARALVKKDPSAQVTIFLMADAVVAGRAQQKTPEGYYNIERMLKRVISSNGSVLLCGTCMDARGMSETELLEGAQRSTMDALANATAEADKVLIF
ncbi:MAG TPA: DsrE family protein [Pseudolabrys sp.]